MDREVLSRFLDAAKEIAQTAGRAILEIPVDDAGVEAKGDGSPLTRADMASHHAIEAGLAVLEPKLPILSEEGDLDADVETWDVFWCVDPLDGTKEFIKGLDEYTTNIAIIENGAAILGAVYVPVKDVLYYAAEGLGAWKVEGGGAAQARHVDQPHMSRRPRRADPVQVAHVIVAHLHRMRPRVGGVVHLGEEKPRRVLKPPPLQPMPQVTVDEAGAGILRAHLKDFDISNAILCRWVFPDHIFDPCC